jgi:hypothetical protein
MRCKDFGFSSIKTMLFLTGVKTMLRQIVMFTLVTGLITTPVVFAQQPNTASGKGSESLGSMKSGKDPARQDGHAVAGNTRKQKTDGETEIGPASGAWNGNVQHPKY